MLVRGAETDVNAVIAICQTLQQVSTAMVESFSSAADDGPAFLQRLVSSRYGLEGVNPPPRPSSAGAAAEEVVAAGEEEEVAEEQPDWSKFLLDDFAPPRDGDTADSIVTHTNQHLTSASGGDAGGLEDGNMDLLNPTAFADALVEADVAELQFEFESLKRIASGGGGVTHGLTGDGVDGICELVAAHLLELWAVQSVGAADAGQLLAEAAGKPNKRTHVSPRVATTTDVRLSFP